MHKFYTHPSPPDSLIKLQTWFSTAVCAIDPKDKKITQKQSSQFLTASSKQNHNERLSVYMSDYWPRCLDNLAEDFPLLRQYLGEDRFLSTMQQYIQTYPPSSFTLLFIGQNLQSFLLQNYQKEDASLIQDIVAFEWAKIESFAAENSACFDPTLLNESQKQQLSELALTLHPSVRILDLHFPVHKSLSSKPKATTLCVYRHNLSVQHMVLHPLLAQFLRCFSHPISISDAVEHMLHSLSKKDVYILETSLQSWVSEAVTHQWFQHPKL